MAIDTRPPVLGNTPSNATRPPGVGRRAIRAFVECLHRWQSLISAMIALGAAAWAWQYTQRQIEISREQLAVAARQADSAQKQLDIAAKQTENSQRQLALMELDQRPYIWPEIRGVPDFQVENSAIFWNWECKNIGKSPAIEVRSQTFMKLGNGALQKSRQPYSTAFSIVPVGNDQWSTAYSAQNYTRRDFDQLMKTTGGIKLVVKVNYSEGRGSTYEVTRCFAMNSNGTTGLCSDTVPE